MKIFKWFFGDSGALPDDAPSETSKPISLNLSIQADRPIQKVSEDIFDRAPFARQVAEIVAKRLDPSSLVVGIYGPWGDGKTSALAMIKEYLESQDDILTMDYNPWFYGDNTEALTRSFFQSIRSKLEEVGWLSRENVGELLSTLGPAVPYGGEAIKNIGQGISTETLTKTRDKLGQLLRKHQKKIVVFIDDIDRLDRNDIQTLFKLVRLSGGFDHTTYLLAFDDAVVADALGEAYGSGDRYAGRRFLEKIVQVPLHLPPPKFEKLRDLVFSACDRIVTESGLKLNDGEGSELGHALASCLAYALKTPRQVKLFENALSFAVPLLKSEVRIVDLIQIEAIRVFYPVIYDVVRKNPSDLIGSRENGLGNQQEASSIDVSLDSLEVSGREKQAVRDALIGLFPRFGATGYGSDWDTRWASEKRICSRDYFSRYFTYTVPTGDMSDLAIEELLTLAANGEELAVGENVRRSFESGAAEMLVRKLRNREESLDLAAAPTLIAQLAKNSALIPVSPDLFLSDFAYSQAGILVAKISSRASAAEQDAWIAEAIERSSSFLFMVQVLRWCKLRQSSNDGVGFLSVERAYPLAEMIFRRLKAASRENDVFDVAGNDLAKVLYIILDNGNPATLAEMREFLNDVVNSQPTSVVQFLKAFAGRSQGSDGVTSISDLSPDVYNTLTRLFDLGQLYKSLASVYGSELANLPWRDSWDDKEDVDRRVAEQFAYLHHHPPKPKEEKA